MIAQVVEENKCTVRFKTVASTADSAPCLSFVEMKSPDEYCCNQWSPSRGFHLTLRLIGESIIGVTSFTTSLNMYLKSGIYIIGNKGKKGNELMIFPNERNHRKLK